MELVLQLRLSTLRPRSYRLRIVPVECSTGLGMVQLRSILVISRNQKRHAEGSAHDTLLTVRALAEPQRQIADRLRTALDPQRLVVVEAVVLRLHACVLDHRASVRLQPRHRAPYVPVDLDYLLDRRRLQERRRYALLYAQHYTAARRHSDCRRSELDRLQRVFDLEETAFGREGTRRGRGLGMRGSL